MPAAYLGYVIRLHKLDTDVCVAGQRKNLHTGSRPNPAIWRNPTNSSYIVSSSRRPSPKPRNNFENSAVYANTVALMLWLQLVLTLPNAMQSELHDLLLRSMKFHYSPLWLLLSEEPKNYTSKLCTNASAEFIRENFRKFCCYLRLLSFTTCSFSCIWSRPLRETCWLECTI